MEGQVQGRVGEMEGQVRGRGRRDVAVLSGSVRWGEKRWMYTFPLEL